MDYIDRIKQLKNEQKITNDRLSEMTGIPLGTLSKILAGISDSPKLANIVSIAEALGSSLDYIVSGVEQNHHNYTLSEDEIALIEDYRALDGFGRELTRMVVSKEGERVQSTLTPMMEIKQQKTEKKTSAKILTPNFGEARRTGVGKRSILLYDLPVSAGPGVYLDDELAEEIQVPDNEKTQAASFALRIQGNSMEPKYHDGDVLLVEDTDAIEVGELGIFILDGNGYFKKYGGDCLISLNPEYGDILLKEYAEAVCCGRVIGKLKKKVSV
ncbi:MAG: helix-turn-helix domain-containing protein [Clostridia bacterium]|nr:helix-turn-helix domain-containing protein [Clostridia bacterium]